jgi:hypothetical protein
MEAVTKELFLSLDAHFSMGSTPLSVDPASLFLPWVSVGLFLSFVADWPLGSGDPLPLFLKRLLLRWLGQIYHATWSFVYHLYCYVSCGMPVYITKSAAQQSTCIAIEYKLAAVVKRETTKLSPKLGIEVTGKEGQSFWCWVASCSWNYLFVPKAPGQTGQAPALTTWQIFQNNFTAAAAE